LKILKRQQYLNEWILRVIYYVWIWTNKQFVNRFSFKRLLLRPIRTEYSRLQRCLIINSLTVLLRLCTSNLRIIIQAYYIFSGVFRCTIKSSSHNSATDAILCMKNLVIIWHCRGCILKGWYSEWLHSEWLYSEWVEFYLFSANELSAFANNELLTPTEHPRLWSVKLNPTFFKFTNKSKQNKQL